MRNKNQIENVTQDEIIIPECLFKKSKQKKVYNLETKEQIARENIKMNDKELDEELSRKIVTPHYSTDENSKIGFKIELDNHNIIHANSVLSITSIYPDFGIEKSYNNKILEETSTIYARLKNQYKVKYHILFSANFYKINEDDQKSDEIDLFLC